MPRSKPSITTYIIMPKRMMTAQMSGRSMPMRVSSLAVGGRCVGAADSRPRSACVAGPARPPRLAASKRLRPDRDQPQQVAGAGAEDGEVHDDEQASVSASCAAPCGETASAVRITPYTTHGWRPISVVNQPASMREQPAGPIGSAERRNGRDREQRAAAPAQQAPEAEQRSSASRGRP